MTIAGVILGSLIVPLCFAGGVAGVVDGPQLADVFVSGVDGYDTYRIPALLMTPGGALLAFCEGRKSSRSDSGDIACLFEGGDKYPYERTALARFSRDWLTHTDVRP